MGRPFQGGKTAELKLAVLCALGQISALQAKEFFWRQGWTKGADPSCWRGAVLPAQEGGKRGRGKGEKQRSPTYFCHPKEYDPVGAPAPAPLSSLLSCLHLLISYDWSVNSQLLFKPSKLSPHFLRQTWILCCLEESRLN